MPIVRSARTDIAALYQGRNFDLAGVVARARMDGLDAGRYRLSVIMQERDGRLGECPFGLEIDLR